MSGIVYDTWCEIRDTNAFANAMARRRAERETSFNNMITRLESFATLEQSVINEMRESGVDPDEAIINIDDSDDESVDDMDERSEAEEEEDMEQVDSMELDDVDDVDDIFRF